MNVSADWQVFQPLARSIAIFFLSLIGWALPTAAAESGRDFNQMLIYYGDAPVLTEDIARIVASFELVAIDRWRYRELIPDSWTRLRQLNPRISIFLYQLGPQSSTVDDSQAQIYLNNISRYRNPRGHPMGAIAQDQSGLTLRNNLGSKIRPPDLPDFVQLDFGAPNLQQYWATATELDILTQPWRADGIFIDNCSVDGGSGVARPLNTERPSRYATAAAWNAGMNNFVRSTSSYLHTQKQKVMANRGGSRQPEGRSAWLALDAMASAPDFVMEEGAFAVTWGSGDVQFYPSNHWLSQVTLAQSLHHSSVAYVSHTALEPGTTGVDSAGLPVSFGQIFLFSAASYLLARNDEQKPTYFSFNSLRGHQGYKRAERFTALDAIRPGRSVGNVQPLDAGGVQLYERQFEMARVIVNPTATPAIVPIDSPMLRVLSSDGKSTSLQSVADALHIAAHSAAILIPMDK